MALVGTLWTHKWTIPFMINVFINRLRIRMHAGDKQIVLHAYCCAWLLVFLCCCSRVFVINTLATLGTLAFFCDHQANKLHARHSAHAHAWSPCMARELCRMASANHTHRRQLHRCPVSVPILCMCGVFITGAFASAWRSRRMNENESETELCTRFYWQ